MPRILPHLYIHLVHRLVLTLKLLTSVSLTCCVALPVLNNYFGLLHLSLSQNCPLKGKILLVTEEDGSGLKGLEGTQKDRAQTLWPCLGPGTISSDGDIPLAPLVPQQPDEVVWSQDKPSAIWIPSLWQLVCFACEKRQCLSLCRGLGFVILLPQPLSAEITSLGHHTPL